MTTFPDLDLDSWRPTRDALRDYARVLGQMRRALAPPQKHWWHITLIPSVRGLTTTPMPGERGAIELTLDIANSRVEAISSDGSSEELALVGQSARDINVALERAVRNFGTEPPLLTPAGNSTHRYDPSAARRFWSVWRNSTLR